MRVLIVYRGDNSKKTDRNISLQSVLLLSGEVLLLPGLVPLIEHINSAGGVDNLGLSGVERMRAAGDLKLHYRVLNSIDNDRFLRVNAGTGDEYLLVGHILESYKTVVFGMNSFLHNYTSVLNKRAKIAFFLKLPISSLEFFDIMVDFVELGRDFDALRAMGNASAAAYAVAGLPEFGHRAVVSHEEGPSRLAVILVLG